MIFCVKNLKINNNNQLTLFLRPNLFYIKKTHHFMKKKVLAPIIFCFYVSKPTLH